MNEQMKFPETFEEFAKEYGFKDKKEIYTNGDDLIPIFRVKQWIEHDNKLRKIETDTAYECGKHANRWISVSERLPKEGQRVLVTQIVTLTGSERTVVYGTRFPFDKIKEKYITAWMPLPEPYTESEDKRNET